MTILLAIMLLVESATCEGQWSKWVNAWRNCQTCSICQQRSCTGQCEGPSTRLVTCYEDKACKKDTLENHSLNKIVTQSTDGRPGVGAATDGYWYNKYQAGDSGGPTDILDRPACARTAATETPNWIQVELGKRKAINYVMLLNRLGYENLLERFSLVVMVGDKMVGSCTSHTDPGNLLPSRAPGLFKCSSRLVGDTVRLQREKGQGEEFTICEFGVYTGDPGCWNSSGHGYDYVGPIHHTIWGTECAPWTSTVNVLKDKFKADHNMCRNFEGSAMDTPFCFTKAGEKVKCPAPICMQHNTSALGNVCRVGSKTAGAMFYGIIAAVSCILVGPFCFLLCNCYRKKCKKPPATSKWQMESGKKIPPFPVESMGTTVTGTGSESQMSYVSTVSSENSV